MPGRTGFSSATERKPRPAMTASRLAALARVDAALDFLRGGLAALQARER